MPSLKKFREMSGLPDTVRRWKQAAEIVKTGQGTEAPAPEPHSENDQSDPTPLQLLRTEGGTIDRAPKSWWKSEAESSRAPWVPPRITNPRVGVGRQMRGKGFKFKDGYPVHLPPGGSGSTFDTGECTYKYNQDGALFLIWERTTWNQQRAVQYESIIDQPLVLDGGKPAKSMFRFHHGWIKATPSYRKTKMDGVRNVKPKIAAKRVAWFEDGKVVYTTTIGDLLVQSLLIMED